MLTCNEIGHRTMRMASPANRTPLSGIRMDGGSVSAQKTCLSGQAFARLATRTLPANVSGPRPRFLERDRPVPARGIAPGDNTPSRRSPSHSSR